MKKKVLTTIFLVIMILTVAGVAFVPHQANADWTCIFGGPKACAYDVAGGLIIDQIGAAIGNSIMGIAAYFLTLMGLLLNVSIILTMNIKAIYQATPAIDSVWVVIRNLSSIFIIFALIYTSIMTILDMGGQKLSALVKNIVVAGLLINFSLFFTKIAIDASNLVSLQFFRAIAPNTQSIIPKDAIKDITSKTFTDGGISAVFMQGLQIPQIYNQQTGKRVLEIVSGKNSTSFKILVSTILGSTLMILAGLSFLAAAIAFTVRIVILLLLMGFSPVYFVGMIFPSIKKDISDKWFGWLKQQLIFMPVYLLFMYVAMSFITTVNADATKSFFGLLGDSQNSDAANASLNGIILSNVGLLIQYTIALILMLIPLLAAKEVGGGLSTKWGVAAKDWVSGKVKDWSKGTAGFAGRNALGASASRFGESRFMREFSGKNPFMGRIAQGGLSKVSSASFGGKKGGYDAQVKADRKAMEALDKKIGTVNRFDYKTDAEFNAAKDAAKQSQETYRQTLGSRNLINLLVNGRAGQSSAAKLIEDAKKKAAKKNKNENEKKLSDKQKRINEIDEKLKNPTEGVGFGQRSLSQSEIDRLKKERSDAKEEMAQIAEEISLAKEAEQSDLIDGIKNATKDGGDEKPDKSGDKKDK